MSHRGTPSNGFVMNFLKKSRDFNNDYFLKRTNGTTINRIIFLNAINSSKVRLLLHNFFYLGYERLLNCYLNELYRTRYTVVERDHY